jgi:hypothetical protein
MKRRTVRNFPHRGDLWPIVESWAAEAGFIEREREPDRRLYRKGGRFLMPPTYLEIRHEQGEVTLEGWVKADVFLILNFLTGQKPEAPLESGGLAASVPRRRARKAINPLLKRLGQKPIG